MTGIDFQLRPRVIFGVGSLQRLGELARELGAERVLIVADKGIVAAGHFESGRASLVAAGLHVASFHEFSENPTATQVDAGLLSAAMFNRIYLLDSAVAVVWTALKGSTLFIAAAAAFMITGHW